MDIEYLKSKILKGDGKICNLLYLRNNFPEIIEYIDLNFSGDSLNEKLFRIVNNIENTPKCKNCNQKEVNFSGNYSKGYFEYCSLKCRSNHPDIIAKKKNTMLEKYGVENNFSNGVLRDKIYETCFSKYGAKTPIQNKEIRKKYEKTMIEKYGVPCNLSLESVQKNIDKTNLKKYGGKRPIQNQDIREKIKKTNLEKYGSEWVINSDHYLTLINEKFSTEDKKINNIFQSEIIKDSIKKNMIQKYGVENIIQNEKYFYQINFKSYSIKKYKDTDLYYQSTYELYFLESMERRGLLNLIKNGLRFKYLLENNNHYYFSDFYIEKLNKIVEIKSSWTYDKNGKDQELKSLNEIKKKTVIDSDLDFELLIGKNEILKFVDNIIM